MIETFTVFLIVFGIFAFSMIVDRNMVTLLAMVSMIIFLTILDYSTMANVYLAFFIVFALVLLAARFYDGMRD
jgi:hypothetical protein